MKTERPVAVVETRTAEDTGAGQTASAFIEEHWNAAGIGNIKTYGESPGGVQFLIDMMGIQYRFSGSGT